MTYLLNALLVVVMILNLFALGTSRINAVIRIAAAQGVLLAAIPLILNDRITSSAILAAVSAAALKGIVIPAIMMRSLRSARIKREVKPMIGHLPSIILGAAATAAALLVSDRTGPAGLRGGNLIVPASIATVLVGFIILTTRFKASRRS